MEILADLSKPSYEQLLAMLVAAQQNNASKVYCKVSEKGALSIYGLQRYPYTFYISQWDAFAANLDKVKAFVAAHRSEFTVKSKPE